MSSKFERSGVVYHAIVKKKVRALFDAVSRGDAGPVISSFSTRFEHTFLGRVSTRIINEVRGINRVVYDITSKPPGTIEWE